MLYRSITRSPGLTRAAMLAAVVFGISACSSSSDDSSGSGANANAQKVAFSASGSFPTGQVERISIDDGYVVDATYPSAISSDILVKTDGKSIYQIGRGDFDTVAQFNPSDASEVGYQYSVKGDETKGNPSDLIFVNETKAYLLRYDSPAVWIVNPAATTEEEFKIGELDLSAYDPDVSDMDASSTADSAVIVDGKLFILLQRLTNFQPIEEGYVAVFDITDDSEIDTLMGAADGLKGIPLETLNPTNIRYNETTDEIYVTGRGNIYVQYNFLEGNPYRGGLFSIDQTTYQVAQLMDDGDQDTNMGQGFIEHTLVLGDETGFVTLYQDSDPTTFAFNNAVFEFNPSTGVIGDPVAAVANREIGPMAVDGDGNVWIGIRGDIPGFSIVNPADTSTEVAFAQTKFNPINIVFLDLPKP